jgi:hypothetical protein
MNFTANFAASQLKTIPTGFKVASYSAGSGNNASLNGVLLVPLNDTQRVNMLINHDAYLGADARNFYFGTGNDANAYQTQIPFRMFVFVSERGSLNESAYSTDRMPAPVWIG